MKLRRICDWVLIAGSAVMIGVSLFYDSDYSKATWWLLMALMWVGMLALNTMEDNRNVPKT